MCVCMLVLLHASHGAVQASMWHIMLIFGVRIMRSGLLWITGGCGLPVCVLQFTGFDSASKTFTDRIPSNLRSMIKPSGLLG